jgi:hypothetical protein
MRLPFASDLMSASSSAMFFVHSIAQRKDHFAHSKIFESSASAILEQESDIRGHATSRGINSNSCVRSGAVTSYTAPSSLLMIRCSVRVNLTNGSGFRHTIVSAITQPPDHLPSLQNSRLL